MTVLDVAEVLPHPATTGAHPRRSIGRVTSVVAVNLAVIVGFAVPAVALFAHAWDGHLGSTLTCECGDTGQEVWFMAWPAYAIQHALDPFISHVVQSPTGVNLLDNTSAIPVGVLFAPLTWAFGPVVSTNVALTLAPALSAWGAWFACRRLVRWQPAALAAGLLFGYSPFVVTNLATGHVSLCLLVAPPLLVLGAHRVVVGPQAQRLRWAIGSGALVAFQFLVSSEILAITLVVGVPALLVAIAFARPSAAELRSMVRALAVGVVVAALLLAVPLWLALHGPDHIVGPPWTATILDANPLQALWDPGAFRGPANTLLELGGYEGALGPPSGYVGPVVLGAAALSLVIGWRRRTVWVLTLAGVVAAVLSLGAVLTIRTGDVSTLWLPWRALGTWPLLDDVIPQRFSALVDLAVALVVGTGLDAFYAAVAGSTRTRATRRVGRRRAGWLLALLAAGACAVSLWWTYQVPFVTRTVSEPRWFADVAPSLPANSVVLVYPFPFPSDGVSAPMTWQALDDMSFVLAGGYVKAPGPGGRPLSTTPTLPPYGTLARLSARAPGTLPRGTTTELASIRAAIKAWGVDEVVVTDLGRDPTLAVQLLHEAIGTAPRRQNGAWVWKVARPGA